MSDLRVTGREVDPETMAMLVSDIVEYHPKGREATRARHLFKHIRAMVERGATEITLHGDALQQLVEEDE